MSAEYKNKLLRKNDVVRSDVFIQDQQVRANVLDALAMGLTPTELTVTEDAVILRFDREHE